MQPKTKTHEAFEELKGYQGLTNPDNFKYLSWLHSGKNLVKTNAVDGYVLQGFANMVMGHADLAVANMKKAHLLKDDLASYNYAVALFNVGNSAESYQVCLDLIKKDPSNQMVVIVAIGNANRSLSIEMLERALALTDVDSEYIKSQSEKTIQFITATLECLQRIGLPREKFVYMTSLLMKFLSSRYFGACHLDIGVSQTEAGNILSMDVYLYNVTSDDCLRFDDEFLDVLIDDKNLDYNDYKDVMIHLVPAEYSDLESA